MPDVAASLSVNRQHLLQALKQIKGLRGTGEQPAVLTYVNGELEITLGGCSFRADANGDWRGQVKVPASFIQRLAKAPPEGDGAIAISTDGTSLKIGFVVTKCQWDGLVYPRIDLPLDATLLDKLTLPLTYSTEDMEHSDLTTTVEAAESERDDLIEKALSILAERDKLVAKAASALEPLGIKESEIWRVLDGIRPTATSPPVSEMRESEIRRLLDDALREMLQGRVLSGDQNEPTEEEKARGPTDEDLESAFMNSPDLRRSGIRRELA